MTATPSAPFSAESSEEPPSGFGEPVLQHATCVAYSGRGVLIMGEPGTGKSSLALRLIDRGAMLVADDYALLSREGQSLIATVPESIAGLLEVRGVGISRQPYRRRAEIALAVRLGREDERLPEPKEWEMLGLRRPMVVMDALRDDSPLKVEMALSGGTIRL